MNDQTRTETQTETETQPCVTEAQPATELDDPEQASHSAPAPDAPVPEAPEAPEAAEAAEAPVLRILRKASCPSVSGRSTLTYHIGVDEFEIVHLRIFANTGKGMWSKGWIPMSEIHQLLAGETEEKQLTSGSLHSLFLGKSVNTAGFLLAVLKNEGLIQTVPGSLRSYQSIEAHSFKEDIQALMEAGVSLDALPVAKPVNKPTTKPITKPIIQPITQPSKKQASRHAKEG